MFVILEWLLLIVEVICCFLLVVVILLQKSRSEGLGMAFGASMGENLFGARASNVLTRITIWLGAIFLVTTTLLAILYAHGSKARQPNAGVPVQAQSAAASSQTQPVGPMTPMPNDAATEAMPGPIAPAAIPLPAAQDAAMPIQAPVPAAEALPAPAAEAIPSAPENTDAQQQGMPEPPLPDNP